MSDKHYFQIKNFEYTHDAFQIGRTGVIAYLFRVFPDGKEKMSFTVKVIFPAPVLKQLGEICIVGSHILKESARPVLLRHAFNLLKQELETSDLMDVKDITVSSSQIAQLKEALPKQCDFREIKPEEWVCQADKRLLLPTRAEVCNACIIPEPLFRCAHLRVKTNWGENDAEGQWRITPECFCNSGKTLPVNLADCQGLYCYTPFKFPLPEKDE